jgi:hypothetical protein
MTADAGSADSLFEGFGVAALGTWGLGVRLAAAALAITGSVALLGGAEGVPARLTMTRGVL